MLKNCIHAQIKKGYLSLFQKAVDYAYAKYKKENSTSEFTLEHIYVFEEDYHTLKTHTKNSRYSNKLTFLYHRPETDEEDCFNLYFEFKAIPTLNCGDIMGRYIGFEK